MFFQRNLGLRKNKGRQGSVRKKGEKWDVGEQADPARAYT